jgi:type IX secretion system PorP/SprF family membrane protein
MFLLLTQNIFGQQKAMYTQYMFNTMAINPAYATVDESLTVTALSRHQWVGFKGAPNTQTLSFHTPIAETNTFIGAILVNDQIGEVIRETGLDLSISQRVPIGIDSYIAAGVNAGASNYGANYSDNYRFSPNSASDPFFQDQNSMRVNFGWGVMLFSDKYYVGLSSPHFYYKDVGSVAKSLAKTAYRPHYLFQAGYLLDLNQDIKLKPNFLVKYVNGSPVQFDMNASVLLKETVWLGASYRSLDSFDALMSIYITSNVQLGYSYDITNTALSKAQKGSHEISLQFRLPVRGRDHTACYF